MSSASSSSAGPLLDNPCCDCPPEFEIRRAKIRTSYQPQSLGRRFYGCPNYRTVVRGEIVEGCGFFRWIDCEIDINRLANLIRELRGENKCYWNKNKALEREITLLREQLRMGCTLRSRNPQFAAEMEDEDAEVMVERLQKMKIKSSGEAARLKGGCNWVGIIFAFLCGLALPYVKNLT